MTLVRYMIKSPSQWQVVECCSASVPLTFSEAIKYTKVFNLFAFLYVCILERKTTLPLSLIAPSFFFQSDIEEQEKVFTLLEKESMGLIEVPVEETAGCFLQ